MIQRLSLEEVQEIARLAAERKVIVRGQGPTVDGVAQTFGLPPDQVASLVAEIRDRKAGLLPPEDRVTFRRMGFAAAGLLTLVLLLVAINLITGASAKEPSASTAAAPVAETPLSPRPRYEASGPPATDISSVATMPGEQIDPGVSRRIYDAPQVEVKTYEGDLSNARTKAGIMKMERTPVPAR